MPAKPVEAGQQARSGREATQTGRTTPLRPPTIVQVRPPGPPGEIAPIVERLSVPPVVASMLWSRGIRAHDVEAVLGPRLEPVPLEGLDEAAERLERAIRERKRILIHGDYDADGLSGTAILLSGLRALGGQARAYIPNRLEDGYGISPARVAEHAGEADLFITVDCGISNLAEVRALQEAGVEVIVTDHHHPGERLPECLVVHASFSAAPGGAELTGAGVAFHLLWRLHERFGEPAPLEYADLAAIGTVADVAPLLGVNRALVSAGLERMRDSRWPGIRASLSQAGLRGPVTARDVAFVIGPRLNAAGRLGEALLGLELLTTASDRRARELAAYLDARNSDRRRIQDEMFEQALAKVDPQAPAIVVEDDRWHPGVMGIVAAKLLEEFYKPTFIVAAGKGSVRSTPGISAVLGLRHAAQHLRGYGGHAQAAGFSLDPAQLPAFREAICEYVASHPTPQPRVTADALLTVREVDTDLLAALDKLEPYGEGHEAPLIALNDRLEAARAVGKDQRTLQLRVAGMRGVAWQKGQLAAQLRVGEPVHALVTVREREWQGKQNLEFVAQEIRDLAPLPLAAHEATASREISFRRGPAPSGEPLYSLNGAAAAPGPLWLRCLPLAGEPLRGTEPLRELAARHGVVYLELGQSDLLKAQEQANVLPDIADVRRAVVFLRRGVALPYSAPKTQLVMTVLEELELLGENGRVRRGVKRDPWSSPTLLAAQLEQYRLAGFVNAYRNLDDEGFAVAATLLLNG